ncbi:MAG TPA: UrcA family protein [Sphingopyxis sp.]|nr:UrcA family protein [Sphingopyxis sp.]
MAKLSLIMLAVPMALAGFSVPAAAEDDIDDDRYTVIVPYNDLNLSSVEGRERLTTRVKYAVKKVCGSRPLHRQTLRERAGSLRCHDTAMADADVKLAGLFNGGGARYADRGRIVVVAAP